jgi:hypothetical protein
MGRGTKEGPATIDITEPGKVEKEEEHFGSEEWHKKYWKEEWNPILAPQKRETLEKENMEFQMADLVRKTLSVEKGFSDNGFLMGVDLHAIEKFSKQLPKEHQARFFEMARDMLKAEKQECIDMPDKDKNKGHSKQEIEKEMTRKLAIIEVARGFLDKTETPERYR